MAISRTPVKFIVADPTFLPREVLSFSYKFEQLRDKQGQISSETKGGEINLTFKSINLGLTDLLRWKLGTPDNPNPTKSGMIEFMNTINGFHTKSIIFTDAFCVEYEEIWKESDGGKFNSERIVLACREIRVDTAKFTNNIRWGQ
jgi:hypothetical protein